MQLIDITVAELFDISDLYFKKIFDDVLYPWNLLPVLKTLISSFPKSNFTEIENGVFVGDNVNIHPSAVIEGPAIIGSGTEIRPSAYIRGSVITGENCVIGNSTEVKNSILMNRVQIPHFNYVGDSILGNHSHLGAGSICSNLKSDGSKVVIHASENINTDLRKLGAILADNADVGCNCVLNPGTVIGKNTSVYPTNSLRGVIPPNSIFKSSDNIVSKI